MVWTNFSTNYTASVVGMMNFGDISTGGLLGPLICLAVYIIVCMATWTRGSKVALMTAGFFCMMTAFFMKWMLTSFSDAYLTFAVGIFLVSFIPIIFMSREN